MMSVIAVGVAKDFPSMDTMVSPAFRPANAAGVCTPDQCSTEPTV